jgi:diphthamide biosynthesis enzyme Dph1/Dph2-like protein
MKTLFIPAKTKSKVNRSKIIQISKKLPKQIVLAYSIQYLDQAKEIKEVLEKNHNITLFTQVLGCSSPLIPKETQGVLIITDGKFHATSLALGTNLPVYILNRNKLELIAKQDISNYQKRKLASYVKFLNARDIGILVSTKPGQQNLERAIELKKKLKDKNSYLFIGNIIDTNEFENFPQIKSWINTACPRIDMNENGVVNIHEIKS